MSLIILVLCLVEVLAANNDAHALSCFEPYGKIWGGLHEHCRTKANVPAVSDS
jgi:hypothetical protein